MTSQAVVPSLMVAALGVLGVVVPWCLLARVRRFQHRGGLYLAAALRLVLGGALLLAFAGSCFPVLLWRLGLILVAAALLTPLFGTARLVCLLDWWAAQGRCSCGCGRCGRWFSVQDWCLRCGHAGGFRVAGQSRCRLQPSGAASRGVLCRS